ncbi:MAG TPA: patatin-like phospholipase family protein [Candidatus Competibacteraceae bacterium]|nr:patatin-like phospholipase family protein [Candidatus Competibacteraceae bacterium]
MAIGKKAGQEESKPYIALVLQGGGALGAYHIGAYQALAEAGYEPDWVSGISIGAINSAVIVGNRPEQRLERLEELWQEISRPDGWGMLLEGALRKLFNRGSATEAILFGQPNFFTPRFPNPYLAPPGTIGATSFYDTGPLRDTLLRLADFGLINSGAVRLSLGATRVTTGELVFFDNTRQSIAPEHVMASGSLPPGFPPTLVEGELYWDGGCVSNTPLQAILDDQPETHTLVFMIDLWDAHGPEPRTMDDVLWRQKQIQYASRTAQHIETSAMRHNLHFALKHLASQASPAMLDSAPVQDALALTQGGRLDIVHITYHPGDDQVPQSDAEFSRPSIASRRAAGYADMKAALAQAPWHLEGRAAHIGAAVHHCRGGEIRSVLPGLRT